MSKCKHVCKSCLDALERAARVVFEMDLSHADQLPPIEPITSYKDLGEFLVRTVGTLRRQNEGEAVQAKSEAV